MDLAELLGELQGHGVRSVTIDFVGRKDGAVETAGAVENKGLGGKDPASTLRRSRVPGRTPNRAFRKPLLEVLGEAEGPLHRPDLVTAAGHRVELSEVDLQPLNGGLPRWRKAAGFELSDMKKEGLVESPERGFWAITAEGEDILG
jgi:restriction endonuclease Mrr